MNLTEKIKSYWHVPTACIAFQKLLLENRNIDAPNSLHHWYQELENIQFLSEEENSLLQTIILRIDENYSNFTLKDFFELTSQVTKSYYNDRYVLLKYNQFVNHYKLWNHFYLNCRGVIIDLEKIEVTTAALKKFFNLNENEFSTYNQLAEYKLSSEQTRTIIYDKFDGSNINVSFKDELFVSTPGAFSSEQAVTARQILELYHSTFLHRLQNSLSHLSFVFEYVSPNNRVVVLYENTELVLLHVINTLTGELLSYDETKQFASDFDFTMCSIVDKDFNTLLATKDDASLYQATEQEGWVIRIDRGNEYPFFVKLKCADYVDVHYLFSNSTNPKWILQSLVDDDFDDKLSSISNEKLRKAIQSLAEVFYTWHTNIKKEFSTVLESIPSDTWMSDELIENHHLFLTEIQNVTKDYPNKDRIATFLFDFAKGKTDNPKEEINLHAKNLFDRGLFDMELYNSYNQYRNFVNIQNKKFVKSFIDASNDFVLNGTHSETYQPLFDEHFSHLKNITENVPDLADWLIRFKEKPEEFNRFASIKIDKLSPNHVAIANYCKNKTEADNLIKSLSTSLRQRIDKFCYERNQDEFLSTVFDNDLIINDKMYAFHMFKYQFDNIMIKLLLRDLNEQDINSVLKSFYSLMNGQEIDNSYDIAKTIFSKLDSTLQNQETYFKSKGQFSNFVHLHVPKHFHGFVFEMFTLKEEERADYLNNVDFLPYCTPVTDNKKETLQPFDVDFRAMHYLINSIPNDN